MKSSTMLAAVALSAIIASGAAHAATVTLYDQDFENPAAYNNDGGDVNPFSTVNANYGNQPPGFQYANSFTVETLNVSGSARGGGTAAFGTGWSDPTGIGGDFAIGMLSSAQDDRLGLSFNVGALPFLNFGIDVSSVDLSTFGGPFVPPGAVPTFRFSIFDNPTGAVNIAGNGTLLDSIEFSGVASAREVFDWRRGVFGLSTAGNTNGNVTFQIDLLTGGYAAFDNLKITASTDPGDLGDVPLPAGLPLLLAGLGVMGWAARKRG